MIDTAVRTALVERLVKKFVTDIRRDYELYRSIRETVAQDAEYAVLGCLSPEELFEEMHACAERGVVLYIDVELTVNPQKKTIYLPANAAVTIGGVKDD